MSKFSYLTPHSIEEALLMYTDEPGQKSVYIAGGTDILLKIKEGRILPTRVISLKHIKTHNNIKINPHTGELIIGSFVTHRMLEYSNLIKQKYKIIHDAISNIGSVQIRNIATIGGNIVNAAPSADSSIPLIALDSYVRLRSKSGHRIFSLLNFFISPGRSVLKPGEILTDIIIPKLSNTSGGYKKFTRRAAMELPIIGIAVSVSLSKKSNICKKARICLGVAAPTPMRAIRAEKLLEGNVVTEELLSKAGILAAEESKVRDSIRGKAWHRKELISVFVKRMGMLALRRIKAS